MHAVLGLYFFLYNLEAMYISLGERPIKYFQIPLSLFFSVENDINTWARLWQTILSTLWCISQPYFWNSPKPLKWDCCWVAEQITHETQSSNSSSQLSTLLEKFPNITPATVRYISRTTKSWEPARSLHATRHCREMMFAVQAEAAANIGEDTSISKRCAARSPPASHFSLVRGHSVIRDAKAKEKKESSPISSDMTTYPSKAVNHTEINDEQRCWSNREQHSFYSPWAHQSSLTENLRGLL
jgi:hypothetical protein